MKSTSIHSYNADQGLGFFPKFLYLFLNWINNLRPYHKIDKRIVFKSFRDLSWRKEWVNTYQASSVGRKLSDLFWRTLPWDKIKEELGELHVFDTGCGQGNYSVRLENAYGGKLDSYTGVDTKRRENWSVLEKEHPNFHFIESSSSDIRNIIPTDANLFITQSAIEHFDQDIFFFEQIREYIAASDKPVIQVHNFPGAASLWLYLFHGVRQYTPRNISKITELFDGARIYMYGLGGGAGKRVQWKHFTWPLLFLRRKATWSNDVVKYDGEVKEAIAHDIECPSKSPIFWVLIIHSNLKKKIW